MISSRKNKVMSVKLRLKNSLLHFLDKLPSKLGFYCYHIIQQKMDSNNFDLKLSRGLGAMNVITKILAEINSSLDDGGIENGIWPPLH